MKRVLYFSFLSLLCAALPLRAEDAATVAARQEAEENFKILKGNVDNLSEANAALLKRIQSLEKEISDLRAQVAKPSGNYATTDDLKHLADAIKEVDKNRVKDNKEIVEKMTELAHIFSKSSGTHVKEPKEPVHTDDPVTPLNPDQPTFTYTIKSGDSYSTIALAYRKEGVKITSEDIQKANPNIKPTQLYVGKKIQIPDLRNATTNKTDTK